MKQIPTWADLVAERVRREGFRAYVRFFWEICDGSPFRPNWHADAIADHLQAVHDYGIMRLAICMPPRLGKSRLCSELFPAYVWADRPTEHILNASYDIGLVTGFATSSVDVIQSELHQQAFPGTSVPAHYRKSDFKNYQGGRRISTIMAGRSTGLGSHIQIIDDPVKASAANGDDPKILQNAISHIDGALSTRAVGDPERFRRVLVMQRLHPKDAAGHVIQDLGWEALVLPMEYSRTVQWDCMSSLQFRDPRSEDGDLLFPGLWSAKAVDRLKIELAGQSGGSVKFVSAQLQQNPQVDGGSFVDASWFGSTRELPWKLPREAYYFSVTDPGHKGTKTSNSRTAMGFFAIHNSRLYWLDAIAQHLRYPDFKDEFLRLHGPGGPWELAQSIRVEDTVNGSPLLAELGWGRDVNDPAVSQAFPFAHRLVGLSPPTAAKEERFRPQTDLIRQGLLSLYDGAWNQDVIHEVTSFPGGQHDDLVDVLTMALEHFRERTSRTNWANIAKIRR